MRDERRESDATLDELLKMKEGCDSSRETVPSDVRNLKVGWPGGLPASSNTVRGKVYWFLRWCIDWIEPNPY